jgi:hypothetical protein
MAALAFALLDCFNPQIASMKNSVRATLEFSFKGETYLLVKVLELDQLAQRYQDSPPLHRLLADEYQIDTYSYQFEIVEQEDILFDQATGAAVPYLAGDVFDFEAYFQHTKTLTPEAALQAIANRELGITDLSTQPQLKLALEQAYQLGLAA